MRNIADRKELYKKIIFFAPVALVFVFVFLKLWFGDAYRAMNQETGIIKGAQSLIYLISSIVAAFVAAGFFKRGPRLYGILYAAFSACLFFVAMEEIGWALRIFNAPVPAYFQTHNIQHEISLHNLPSVRWYVNEAYILLGFFCAFLWLIVPRKIKAIEPSVTGYFIPDRLLMLYFLPVLITYAYFVYLSGILVRLTGINAFHIGFSNGPYVMDFVDQEPAELLMALGFLGFTVMSGYRQAGQKIFDRQKSARFAASFFIYVLALAIPFHIVHAFAESRLYPYDRMEYGRLLYHNGKPDEAIRQYTLALSIDPRHAETYNNMGIALMDLGRYKEADACFLKALEFTTRDASVYYNFGISLYRQGKTGEAAAYYEKAFQVDPRLAQIVKFKPKDEVMLTKIGDALMSKGRAAEAVWFFSRAADLKPDHRTRYNLGCALLAAGKYDEAVTQLTESLRLRSDNAQAQNNLASALAQKGDLEGAIVHYEEAVRINPDLADAHVNMGIILKRQGRNREAFEQFSEALRIDPKYEKARRNLELLGQQK